MSKQNSINEYSKDMTTNDGQKITSTDDSLKVGVQGCTLLEDFHFQEKLSTFDRERIPERVVHARSAGAHGYFQPCASMTELQGRLISYHDTQLHRLGSPNFVQLPINHPVCSFSNNNQDGQMEIKTRAAETALISVLPLPECKVSVIIPAKDEAQMIVATLTALANQTYLNGQPLNPLTYEVIILANNCIDDSAAIARQFAQQHPDLVLHVADVTLPPDLVYIGHVRKMLMDEAYLRLMSLGRSRGIIASTDGDTKVSATWIAAIIHEIESGADAVGGRILTDRDSRQALHPQAKSHFLQEVGYRSLVAQVEFHLDPDPYDPLPRHYQHYGASLAVTAEMYAKAGGIPPVRTPEDEAFYQALLRVDARFRHSPLVQVVTSARVLGRSPVGLAAQLRKWAELSEGSTLKVESAAAMIAWFQSRHRLRSLWQRLLSGSKISVHEVELVAGKLGISTKWLFDELLQHHTFGKLFDRVTHYQEQSYLHRWQMVDVMIAIQELRQYLVTLNHHAG